MTRLYASLTTAVVALALAGCAKNKNDDTQNPDGTGDGTATDGADGTDADADSGRARGSTSTRGGGSKAKGRTATLAAKKPPRAPSKPQDNGPNGLLAEVFALDGAESLPSFESIGGVIETFSVPNLDFDEGETAAGFPGSKKAAGSYAIRFTGSLNVEAEAEYELCLHSDDGSQLLLEGTVVVSNDGVFDSATETCELVYLAAGEYQLEVDYFQAGGELLAMHFAWAVDGGDKVIVPTDVLFKPEAVSTR